MNAQMIYDRNYRSGRRALLNSVAKNQYPDFELAKRLGEAFNNGFTDEWNDLTDNGKFSVSQCCELADRRYEAFDFDGV